MYRGQRTDVPDHLKGKGVVPQPLFFKHLIMQTPKPNKEALPLRIIKLQSLRLGQAALAYAAFMIIIELCL